MVQLAVGSEGLILSKDVYTPPFDSQHGHQYTPYQNKVNE